MVDSIVHDQKRVLPCAAYLTGEFGLDGIFMGVPCRLGAAGLEEIIKLNLSEDEQAQLNRSAEAVRELVGVMGL
jgi:malate dehydrogenase